jgi:hypothetical protein
VPPPVASQLPPLPALRSDISKIVDTVSKQEGVPAWLLRTMGRIESGSSTDPAKAVSQDKRHRGVFQMGDSEFAQYNPNGPRGNVFNPMDNAVGAARYMKDLLQQFGGDPVFAAGAFNVGPGAMRTYIEEQKRGNVTHPLPEETMEYMLRVAMEQTSNENIPVPPIIKADQTQALTPEAQLNQIFPQNAGPVQFQNVNRDPLKGKYNFLEALGGHQDLPFILEAADEEDKQNALKAAKAAGKSWVPIIGVIPGYKKYQGPVVREALHTWATNPGAAGAKWGLNSDHSLDIYANSDSPVNQAYAKFMRSNEWVRGAATFGLELANPFAWAENVATGAGLKVAQGAGWGLTKMAVGPEQAAKLSQGADRAMAYFQNLLSPFRDIVMAHGEPVRNLLASIGARMGNKQNQAKQEMLSVFDQTSRDEKLIIERVRAHEPPQFPDSMPMSRRMELVQRADILRDITRRVTAARLHSGTLQQSEVFSSQASQAMHPNGFDLFHELEDGTKVQVGKFAGDPGTYFNLKGQYIHPLGSPYEKMTQQLLEAMGVRNERTVAGAEGEKVYGSVDEALEDPRFRKEEYSPADQFFTYLRSSYNRIEFENGMKKVAEMYPDAVKIPKDFRDFQNAVASGKYVSLARRAHPSGQMVGLVDMPNGASDFMKNVLLSPSIATYMSHQNVLSRLTGLSKYNLGFGDNALLKFANVYNGLMRQSIIQNYLYHPLWNIATNTAMGIARGPAVLPTLMTSYTRALLGAGATTLDAIASGVEKFGAPKIFADMDPQSFSAGLRTGSSALDKAREFLERGFMSSAQDHINALKEALDVGAISEFGSPRGSFGGDIARVLTDSPEEMTGNWGQKMLKMFEQQSTRLNDWNSVATFGPRGEAGFAGTYYQRMKDIALKNGMSEEEAKYSAAWATREALGNYRNVDPDSWMSKAIFFWPWLKGNSAFWFKMLAHNRTFIAATENASTKEREAGGDPTIFDTQHPKEGVQFYADGVRYTVPLPLKDMARLADLMGEGVGVMQGRNQLGDFGRDITGYLGDRLTPLLGTAANDILTFYSDKPRDPGTYQGFTTMFNINAEPGLNLAHPLDSQVGQAIAETGIQIMPMPVPFLSRDLANRAISPQNLHLNAVDINNAITQAVGLGVLREDESKALKKGVSSAEARLSQQLTKLRKIQSGPNPLSPDRVRELETQYYEIYKKRMQTVSDRVNAAKQGTGPAGLAPYVGPGTVSPDGSSLVPLNGSSLGSAVPSGLVPYNGQ